MQLAKTQHLLWDLITAPEGVKKALQENPRELPVTGNQKLNGAERLDIYANMYFYRIRDSLKEDFSRVLKVVGEIAFHNLITDYLIKHPSRYFSLREVGRDLPHFLKKYPQFKKWPFLSDLARFEWALIEAFDAAEAPLLFEEDLKKIPPEKWASLRFEFVPSFRFLELNWEVIKIKKPKKIKRALLVWRKGLKVFFKWADPFEAKLIREIEKKKDFGELCRLAPAPTMAKYLMGWIKNEMLKKSPQG